MYCVLCIVYFIFPRSPQYNSSCLLWKLLKGRVSANSRESVCGCYSVKTTFVYCAEVSKWAGILWFADGAQRQEGVRRGEREREERGCSSGALIGSVPSLLASHAALSIRVALCELLGRMC